MTGTDRDILLPDGRQVRLRLFGDDGAPTLFLMHGTPGSRYVSPRITAPVAASGFRLITLDRPGYGGSNPDYPRSLARFANDMGHIIGALDLTKFAVAGVSGGGPHALATATVEGCVSCTVLGGFAPVPSKGPLPEGPNKLAHRLMRLSPALFKLFNTIATKNAIKALQDDTKTERLINAMLAKMPEEDRALISEDDATAGLITNLREAFKQGGDAVGEESLMLGRDWDIDLGTLATPIHWWHGQDDANVAFTDAERFAATLPQMNWHPLAGGHSAWMHHWDEILQTIGKRLT